MGLALIWLGYSLWSGQQKNSIPVQVGAGEVSLSRVAK